MAKTKTESLGKVELPAEMVKKLDKRMISLVRKSTESEIKLADPTAFFKKISQPVESKLFTFMQDVKLKSEEQMDVHGMSKVIEIHPGTNQWRWRYVKNTAQLRTIIKNSEESYMKFMQFREKALIERLKKQSKEGDDFFGGSVGMGSGTDQPYRPQYTPLLGTPFFKQMYLYDYWEMHSKCFWYSNYSGIGKLVVDITRNFVMGKGFSVSFEDSACQDIWDKYEEKNNIQEKARLWCDDLTKFGESMIKRLPQGNSVIHTSFDPSTIWEIVTDPENINDVKYYHQQYNTQYQLYGTKDAPVSKYIFNQMPPELVIHNKVNVTPYEKRGRSDLLSVLLYLKYYEDYMQARLLRAKNEAAFIWDVTIKGGPEDVDTYINNTESMSDVPPGSENVHNESVERKPLSPQFGAVAADQIAADILSYVAMGTIIPLSYFGTTHSGGSTRAGAIVGTEPVSKKMGERQAKMESLLRIVVKDVLIASGKDPLKFKFEINFPELFDEDRSKKIQDLTLAKENGSISHRRMSEMTAKELRITKYDYEQEQIQIAKEAKANSLFQNPDEPDSGADDPEKGRSFDRSGTKDKVAKL